MSDPLALLVAMAAALAVPGPPAAEPQRYPFQGWDPASGPDRSAVTVVTSKRGDGHDDERIARAEAKRARKAARRREVK